MKPLSKSQIAKQVAIEKKVRGILQGLKIKYKSENVFIGYDMILGNLKSAIGTPCPYCGEKKLSIANVQFDHIIPVVRGGENKPENFMFICNTCNRIKDIMNGEEYIDLRNFIAKYPPQVQKMLYGKLRQKPMFAGTRG